MSKCSPKGERSSIPQESEFGGCLIYQGQSGHGTAKSMKRYQLQRGHVLEHILPPILKYTIRWMQSYKHRREPTLVTIPSIGYQSNKPHTVHVVFNRASTSSFLIKTSISFCSLLASSSWPQPRYQPSKTVLNSRTQEF